jgi:hypothetical protein
MTAELAWNTVVVATRQQVSTEMGKERVLLHLTSGKYYSLNKVGARVWALLAEPVSIAQICDVLSTEYAVERARLEADVKSLVTKLCAAGFAEVQA